MKTTVITATGNVFLEPVSPGVYRLTGPTTDTRQITADELMKTLGQEDCGDIELRLLAKDGAEIILSKDVRHGQPGYRGCRYIDFGKPKKMWDESYMFFPTLDEAILLFGRKNLEDAEAGMETARRVF